LRRMHPRVCQIHGQSPRQAKSPEGAEVRYFVERVSKFRGDFGTRFSMKHAAICTVLPTGRCGFHLAEICGKLLWFHASDVIHRRLDSDDNSMLR
jgi:hypothetical protein